MVKLELLQYECLPQLNSEEFQVCLMFIFYVSETSMTFVKRKDLRAGVETEHSNVTSTLTKFALPQQYS